MIKAILLLVFFSWLPAQFATAQQDWPFKPGEELNFNIYYKYGIVMARAGSAEYKISNSMLYGKSSIKSELTFKTTSTFDKIFKVRDTLQAYAGTDLKPVFHKKFLHEGKHEYMEEMYYKQHDKNYTKVRSIRKNKNEVKFDSILYCKGLGFDMLSIFMFARTLNYSRLNPGESIPVYSFVGRDVVEMKLRYKGQTIFEKSDTEKYKTLKFEVDIIDKTFEDNKNAMEIWISDDENHIPVKIKAKLKIGAAEAILASFKNTKNPMNSRIVINPR